MNKKRLSKQSNKHYKALIDYYTELYDLHRLENVIDVSSPVFDYCTQGRIFVSVILVNSAKAIYFRHTLNKFAGWEIPGGFVNEEDSSLEAAAVRIIDNESGLKVDELIPLLVAVNKFKANKVEHDHYGMVFIALVRNNQVAFSSDEYIGNFMETMPKQIINSDKPIVEYAMEHLSKIKFNPPVDEIDESSNLGWKYEFHNRAVRPLQRLISSNKLKNGIKKEISGNSVLDATCGDDSMIVDYANENPKIKCTANDICWFSVQKIIDKAQNNNVIFTNHDVANLPYGKKFDTIIFKNTLHHFDYLTAEKLLRQLNSLVNKKLIVVDVEDPTKTGLIHKLWNQYYRIFLNDQGENFWEYEQFEELIGKILPGSKIKRIRTSRGNYMSAVYEKKGVTNG